MCLHDFDLKRSNQPKASMAAVNINIRQARPTDAPAVTLLFKETIESVNSRDYSAIQVEKWAARHADKARWQHMLEEQCFFLAETNSSLLGFASLDHEGCVVLMFVHKDHQGRGIASKLLQALMAKANEWQLPHLFTHSSITARPFFEKHGFAVAKTQTAEIEGVLLQNFLMQKTLA